MDRIKRSVAAAAGFCLFLVLILFMTAAAVYRIAGDGDLLASEMRRFAPSDVSGLPDAEYPEMGRMTAGYLTGKRPDFQYYLSDGKGNTAACFQQHEVSHMADCRRLIQWAGNLRGIMGGAALILIITAAALRKHRKSFSAGMQQ